MSKTQRRKQANVLVAIVLTAGFVLGAGLIILSGKEGEPEPAAVAKSGPKKSPETTRATRSTLGLDDLTATGLSETTGLVFPTDMTDFLTAELDSDSQLDITFVMAESEVQSFVDASGLSAPESDKRLVLHSSPLWKLNPPGGSTLSGTQGDFGSIHRVVEFVGDGTGSVRARIVITPI